MNIATDKLFSLLRKCSENSDGTTKLQLIAGITQSPDYKELSSSSAFRTLFKEYYSLPVLETLDNETLKQREGMLPDLVMCNNSVIQSLRSGNGPELTSADMPDLTSNRSIRELLDKIRLDRKKINYTNISADDALKIFSDTTIRSAQECFKRLPVSLTRRESISEEDILNCMDETSFCVSIDEFEKIHQDHLIFVRESEKLIQRENTRRKKHLLLKFAVILLCFGAVFASSQFLSFPESYNWFFYGVISVASVLYLIWG